MMPDTEGPTPDEFAEQMEQMMESPDAIDPDSVPVCEEPCIISLRDREFHVRDAWSWAQTSTGIFAIGYWSYKPDEERHVLIPYHAVLFVDTSPGLFPEEAVQDND